MKNQGSFPSRSLSCGDVGCVDAADLSLQVDLFQFSQSSNMCAIWGFHDASYDCNSTLFLCPTAQVCWAQNFGL